MYRTAHGFHRVLCQDWKERTTEAEKLGTLASTLFHCENYTIPLHGDDDEIHGLCAQYFLDPSLPEDLHEYGFIYLKYGFYMVSYTNSLWCIKLSITLCGSDSQDYPRSFDSNEPHGSMLPSAETLHLHGGVSRGSHATQKRRDMAAARREYVTFPHLFLLNFTFSPFQWNPIWILVILVQIQCGTIRCTMIMPLILCLQNS